MSATKIRPEELSAAIAGDGLSLHYLPQLRLATGRIDGVEAFVRWPHPSVGLVGPGEVADLVREGSLHVAFDRWVIRTACLELARWRERGAEVPLAAVSVWPETLDANKGVDAVLAAIEEARAAPAQIEIKLPRGRLGDRAVAALARSGVRLATDEVPEGAAPGVTTLKVRLDTVRDVADRAKLVGTVVEAARRLGARVVADGVETVEQQEALRALGVDVAQGYLYSPEISAAEVAQLVLAER